MSDDFFDLRNDLAEIPAKQDEAYFTLNFKLLAEVRELRAAADADEDLLAQKEAELKAATYTAEMMSTTRRQREDIFEEALEKHPAKPSFFGQQVDETTQFRRNTYARVALVAYGVKRIVSPTGKIQEQDLFDTVQWIHDKAPDEIFEILERKAKELNAKQDEQDELHQSADF